VDLAVALPPQPAISNAPASKTEIEYFCTGDSRT